MVPHVNYDQKFKVMFNSLPCLVHSIIWQDLLFLLLQCPPLLFLFSSLVHFLNTAQLLVSWVFALSLISSFLYDNVLRLVLWVCDLDHDNSKVEKYRLFSRLKAFALTSLNAHVVLYHLTTLSNIKN